MIEPGDVWRVGDSWVHCGDLEQDAGARFLRYLREEVGVTPTMVYCDPPWNAAIATTFRRWVKDERAVAFSALLRVVVEVCEAAGTDDVFLEMGAKHQRDLITLGEAAGLTLGGEWRIVYSRQRPCYLTHFRRPGAAPLATAYQSPAGMADEDTPTWAMQTVPHPAHRVFDPCMGLGCTWRNAVAAGATALGVELNPDRLGRALRDAARSTGHTPQKVVTL